MEQPVTAVYDANILYPAPMRDLFIRLAQAGLVRARWTETIHDEWIRNVLKDNPHLSAERLARTRTLMNEAVRDCLVTGYVRYHRPISKGRVMAKSRKSTKFVPALEPDYGLLVSGISELLDQARHSTVRAVNRLITTSYWEIGRRIVEFEQGGKARAIYGEGLLRRLAQDLTAKHGRGFGMVNLSQMRKFYQLWPDAPILQTPSEKSGPVSAVKSARGRITPLSCAPLRRS
jgi:hypothetical protein